MEGSKFVGATSVTWLVFRLGENASFITIHNSSKQKHHTTGGAKFLYQYNQPTFLTNLKQPYHLKLGGTGPKVLGLSGFLFMRRRLPYPLKIGYIKYTLLVDGGTYINSSKMGSMVMTRVPGLPLYRAGLTFWVIPICFDIFKEICLYLDRCIFFHLFSKKIHSLEWQAGDKNQHRRKEIGNVSDSPRKALIPT